MLTPKELKKALEQDLAMKGLVETYEDVAVANMQKVRQSVLATRIFLEGVSEIYSLAKTAYLVQLSFVTSKKERAKELSFIKRNGKTLTIFISGNQSLLGNIIFQTYKAYLALRLKVESDHLVLGKVGSYLAKSARPAFKFTEFPLNDYEIKPAEMKPIVDFVSQYEKILVVYPKFVSVLRQEPAIDDISGGSKVEQSFEGKKAYFFEPNAREVMSYFEGQIIGALLRQKVLEAQLARYSARLTIMDSAAHTISKIVEKSQKVQVLVERRESNKKLLNSFSGVSLWSK